MELGEARRGEVSRRGAKRGGMHRTEAKRREATQYEVKHIEAKSAKWCGEKQHVTNCGKLKQSEAKSNEASRNKAQ